MKKKSFWNRWARVISGRKGSSTVEYVAILVAGALLAGILHQVFMTDGKQALQSALARILSFDRLTISSSPPPQPPGTNPKDAPGDNPSFSNLPAGDQDPAQPQELGPTPDQQNHLKPMSQKSAPKSKEEKQKEKEARKICKELAKEYPAISYQQCMDDITNEERLKESKESAKNGLDILTDNLPLIGNGKSAYEAATGKNIFGEEISETEQALAAAGIAFPWAKNLRHSKHSKKLLQFFGFSEDGAKSATKGGSKAGSGSGGSGKGGKGNKGDKKVSLPSLQPIPEKKLQKKFKHASDFGISGNFSKTNAKAYGEAIQNHVSSADSVYKSSYRDPKDVYVYLKDDLAVLTDMNGNFISGWRLSPEQLKHHTTVGVKVR